MWHWFFFPQVTANDLVLVMFHIHDSRRTGNPGNDWSSHTMSEDSCDRDNDSDFVFEPVSNLSYVVFSINIRRTCDAFDVPFDERLLDSLVPLADKKFAGFVDRVGILSTILLCSRL